MKIRIYSSVLDDLRWLVASVLMVISLSLSAQTYYIDESVAQQYSIATIGMGSFTPDLWYDGVHKNYRNTAMITNKCLLRLGMKNQLIKEITHAEHLDSALTDRKRVEIGDAGKGIVGYIEDRTPGVGDFAWFVEKDKIEHPQSLLYNNIGQIVLLGGTIAAREAWEERYNAIDCGLRAVRDGYMPQGKRKEQYLAIYRDLVDKNNELSQYLNYLRGVRDIRKLDDASSPKYANLVSVARSAHGRWKANLGNYYQGKYTVESADFRWQRIRYGKDQ